jgi:hypothetical protein
MQIFLNEVSSRHQEERIVMILDGAGWHRAGELVVPDNMKLVSLPPYAPELTRSSIYGMNYGKRVLAMLYSTALMPLKTIWKYLSGKWKPIRKKRFLSLVGLGL